MTRGSNPRTPTSEAQSRVKKRIDALLAGIRRPQRCFVSRRNREGRAASSWSDGDMRLVAESPTDKLLVTEPALRQTRSVFGVNEHIDDVEAGIRAEISGELGSHTT